MPKRRSNAAPGWAAWVVPSLADVVFAALLAFVLALRAHQLFNSDGDLARHLAVGRQILDSGVVPTVDLFSHTKAGEPFVPYEWLSEVLNTLIYRQIGLEGIGVFSAVLVALPFLLLTRWAIRDGGNPFLVLLLVTVGALASSMHWLARPHLFTLLLATLWTRALVRHQATGQLRYLLPLPPMMALWANLHGGFLVGFVILGIFILGAISRQRSAIRSQKSELGTQNSEHLAPRSALSTQHSALMLAGIGVACLVAVGANPVGYAVLPHVMSYFGHRLLVDVTVEYMSPNFHDVGPQLFLGLVLVALAAMAALPRKVDLADLAMLLVWISFSLYSARNIPIFVVTCLPILARLASEALGQFHRDIFPSRQGRAQGRGGRGVADRLGATERQLGRPLLPILAVGVALLVSTGSFGNARPAAGFDPAAFPVEALRRAESLGVSGNLFNELGWGGYVLFASYPRYQVFIDGQTDFYGEDLTRDYLEVARLKPNWEMILDRYQIGWVLFPHQSPLSQALARSPGWKLAHEDGTADIFLRAVPEGR